MNFSYFHVKLYNKRCDSNQTAWLYLDQVTLKTCTVDVKREKIYDKKTSNLGNIQDWLIRYARIITNKKQKILKILCSPKMDRWYTNSFEILCKIIFTNIGISQTVSCRPIGNTVHLISKSENNNTPQYSVPERS